MKATKQLNLHSHQMMWHPFTNTLPSPYQYRYDILPHSFTKASRQCGYSVYVVDAVC